MGRLEDCKDNYRRALIAYEEQRANFSLWQKQFGGDLAMPKGKAARTNYNFTKELIEAQIDSSIPQPAVQPRNPTERGRELAEIITSMLRCELDRLPFEHLNDLDERVSRIMGGSAYLVEWDSGRQTRDSSGAISVRLLSPLELIPQEAVFELSRMDYFFLTFDDTKSRIKARYGKEVTDEGTDPQTSDSQNPDELVTQVICFYRSDKNGIGCLSWAGETVLIDDTGYFARKGKVCARCGKRQPAGEKTCACGGAEWVKQPKDFELLTEDIVRSDGVVIPAMSPVRSADGSFETESYEEQAVDPQTGYPLYEDTFDEAGLPTGLQPRREQKQRVAFAPTQIPYYYPHAFPVAIRKNVSEYRAFFGGSDCAAIREHQLQANKAMSKLDQKLVSTSDFFTKPKDLHFTLTNDDTEVLNLESPAQLGMIRALSLKFDMGAEYNVVERAYYMAKSLLGVSDTFQGKADATATSGRAKEIQVAQAAGIQKSKRVMKNAAYAALFETMFHFMLAYADEPRVYTAMDENGAQVEKIFNRYDFLEQDAYGGWFYNDEFLFSVDEAGAMQTDKQFLLEDVRTDFGMGAFGNPQDSEAILLYWKEKEVLGYPNAKRMVKHWQEKLEQMAQQAQMREQMAQMAQMAAPSEMGGMPLEMRELQA